MRLLTGPTGGVTDTYAFEAYGDEALQTGGTDNPYRFAGEQLDLDADAYYLRARYYDPDAGVFLSRDPLLGRLAQPASQHAYQYALDSLTNFIDPAGEARLGSVVVTVGILAGLVAVLGPRIGLGDEDSCGSADWVLVVRVVGKIDSRFCGESSPWLPVWQSRLLTQLEDRVRVHEESIGQLRTASGTVVSVGPTDETGVSLRDVYRRIGRTPQSGVGIRARIARFFRGQRRFEVETPNAVIGARG